MNRYSILLEPVWGLDEKKVKPLVSAAESNDAAQIAAAIRSLEGMLAANPCCGEKRRAFEAEIRAKISVLRAVRSGDQMDWQGASIAYQELQGAMDNLAASCCSCEDIAEVMFKADAAHAGKLAALCQRQIDGEEGEADRKYFAEEARHLIQGVGPKLGFDRTEMPKFPEGTDRHDVCAVRHTAENGSSFGYDTIYLVWKKEKGSLLQYRELINSRRSKDYIHIHGLSVEADDVITEVGSGGSYSGSAWTRYIHVPLQELFS